MKLFERRHAEETIDRLPELPAGVEVPDDISGLEPPTTLRRPTGGVRWMRWLAAILLLGAAGGVSAAILSGDDAVEAPAEATVDLMIRDGSDNETFVENALPPGTRVIHTMDYMALYGTDNPVFVPGAAEANSTFHGEYMRLYGTDNPSFPVIDPMFKYGTVNPDLLP